MKIKEFKCPNCGAESKFVFWIGNCFVEMNSEFKIVQSNYTGYAVDKILNKNEIDELAQICSKEGNEILSDCKKCTNDKTVEVVFEDEECVDGLAKNALIEMLKHVDSSETNSEVEGTTMTDYEREVEKLKKWINSLKPKTVKAGRKAAQISIEDFQKKLYEAVPPHDRDEEIKNMNTHDWGTLIFNLKCSNQSLEKDFEKVNFDGENNECKFYIHNSVAFALGWAGGDWECAVMYFVYHDGKNFRCYIPEAGNFYNVLGKVAFGSESEVDVNCPAMKKINTISTNCKDGSFPANVDDYDILGLCGIYYHTKKEDLNWNQCNDAYPFCEEYWNEKTGKQEFFARLGI